MWLFSLYVSTSFLQLNRQVESSTEDTEETSDDAPTTSSATESATTKERTTTSATKGNDLNNFQTKIWFGEINS